MKTENYKIRDLLKASHVKRWHIVDTVKTQSLAEHQWSVCMISDALARLMEVGSSGRYDIMQYALLHDIDEVWNGDIPTPAKENLRANGSLSSESLMGVGTWVAGIAAASDDGPPVRSGGIKIPISAIVRCADLIETYVWIRKYGLDVTVKKDCGARLKGYLEFVPIGLKRAAVQIIRELTEK